MNLSKRGRWFLFLTAVALSISASSPAAAMQIEIGNVEKEFVHHASRASPQPATLTFGLPPEMASVPVTITNFLYTPMTLEQIMMLPEPVRSLILQTWGLAAAPALGSSTVSQGTTPTSGPGLVFSSESDLDSAAISAQDEIITTEPESFLGRVWLWCFSFIPLR